LLLLCPALSLAQEASEEVASEYRYDPTGKRDPFRPPYMVGMRRGAAEAPKTPLQRYELGQLKLVGVVWEQDEPKALIEDSAGLGYVVGRGALIGPNGGVVKRIEPDRLVVEEEFLDFYGRTRKREVPLELAPAEAGGEEGERE
jgi:type IV pilus assembly protein PilP